MNDFVYYAPTKVIFGRNANDQIASELKSLGAGKVLLHYGGGSIKKNGLYDKIVSDLKAEGIDFVELGNVEPNPKVSLVREGTELCKKEKVDFILAVGGGSVIDSAKAIGISYANDADVWDIFTGKVPAVKRTPVGVVLTISAAGSEMSRSDVLSYPEYNIKRGFSTDLHRPVVAFMNPENTFTVSKYQTGCGIVDILMHTLERYLSVETDNELTDRISEAVLLSVVNAGKVAIAEPENYEARATLMWASSLSHNGLTGCGKDTVMTVHAMEHAVSGLFDRVAHGAGLAVLYPAFALWVYKKDIRKFSQLATRVWNIPMDFDHPEKTALNGIIAMKEYFKSIGMPTTMAELDVGPEYYEQLADLATDNGKKTLKSVVPVDRDAVIEIFKLAE